MWGNDGVTHEFLHLEDSRAVEDRRHPRRLGAGGAVDDRQQLVEIGIADDQLEEEAVELGFGKGVGALLLDGVLGGHHEEGGIKAVVMAGDGDGFFLHRFEEGGLALGRGAVDLVGEDDIGEDGALLELEVPAAGGGVFGDEVGADDVGGHEIGGELDAAEAEAEGLGERADEHGFAEARDAFEEDVSADEEGGEHAVHDLAVSDDDLADLVAQGLVGGAELGALALDMVGSDRGGGGSGGVWSGHALILAAVTVG